MDMVEALTGFRDWLKEDSKDRPKGLSLIHDILKPAGRGIYDLANMSGRAAQGEYIDPTAITKPLVDAGVGQGALAMTKGALMREAYEPNMVNAFVWQGGPHKYGPEGAAQSLQHIGKGEGAQAYGWGRYDAGAEDVGKIYQQNLAGRDVTVDGRTPDWDNPADIAALKLSDYKGDVRKAIDDLRGSAGARTVDAKNKKIAEDAIALLEAGNGIPTAESISRGYLYKHDLPDEDIARYLDWDAPLSESEMIRVYEALDAENPNFARAFQDNWYSTNEAGREAWSGQDLYYELSKQYGSNKAASEALASAGIPGLKYYDGSSRTAASPKVVNADDGYDVFWGNDPRPVGRFTTKAEAEAVAAEIDGRTRNYVTWDQDVLNRMKLLERNGVDMTKALMGNQ